MLEKMPALFIWAYTALKKGYTLLIVM